MTFLSFRFFFYPNGDAARNHTPLPSSSSFPPSPSSLSSPPLFFLFFSFLHVHTNNTYVTLLFLYPKHFWFVGRGKQFKHMLLLFPCLFSLLHFSDSLFYPHGIVSSDSKYETLSLFSDPSFRQIIPIVRLVIYASNSLTSSSLLPRSSHIRLFLSPFIFTTTKSKQDNHHFSFLK